MQESALSRREKDPGVNPCKRRRIRWKVIWEGAYRAATATQKMQPKGPQGGDVAGGQQDMALIADGD